MSVASSTMQHIVLDGSRLEGGGQILRNCVALAALLGKPVKVDNVRGNRNPPGLKAQHATGLQLLSDICGASTEGIQKASRTVIFEPGPIRAGEYTADPGTAGATSLLLQTSLPCLFFARKQSEVSEECNADTAVNQTISALTLCGGTNALLAPPVDYTMHVLFPFLFRRFGISDELTLDIIKRGFYPYGGGKLRVRIPALMNGQTLSAVNISERGSVIALHGISYVSGPLPRRIANEMRDAALKELSSLTAIDADSSLSRSVQTDIHLEFLSPKDKAGSGIVLWAETSTGCILGGSSIGSKGTDAAKIGRAAAKELLGNLIHGGCVDEYLQDQIIIFLALAKGRSTVKTGPLTLHTETAIWVAETLTDAKFEVTDLHTDTGQVLVTCDGIGLEGRS